MFAPLVWILIVSSVVNGGEHYLRKRDELIKNGDQFQSPRSSARITNTYLPPKPDGLPTNTNDGDAIVVEAKSSEPSTTENGFSNNSPSELQNQPRLSENANGGYQSNGKFEDFSINPQINTAGSGGRSTTSDYSSSQEANEVEPFLSTKPSDGRFVSSGAALFQSNLSSQAGLPPRSGLNTESEQINREVVRNNGYNLPQIQQNNLFRSNSEESAPNPAFTTKSETQSNSANFPNQYNPLSLKENRGDFTSQASSDSRYKSTSNYEPPSSENLPLNRLEQPTINYNPPGGSGQFGYPQIQENRNSFVPTNEYTSASVRLNYGPPIKEPVIGNNAQPFDIPQIQGNQNRFAPSNGYNSGRPTLNYGPPIKVESYDPNCEQPNSNYRPSDNYGTPLISSGHDAHNSVPPASPFGYQLQNTGNLPVNTFRNDLGFDQGQRGTGIGIQGDTRQQRANFYDQFSAVNIRNQANAGQESFGTHSSPNTETRFHGSPGQNYLAPNINQFDQNSRPGYNYEHPVQPNPVFRGQSEAYSNSFLSVRSRQNVFNSLPLPIDNNLILRSNSDLNFGRNLVAAGEKSRSPSAPIENSQGYAHDGGYVY